MYKHARTRTHTQIVHSAKLNCLVSIWFVFCFVLWLMHRFWELELLGQRVNAYGILLDVANVSLHKLNILHFHSQGIRVTIYHQPLQQRVFSNFLIFANLMSQEYLNLVLIFIYCEHIFIWLRAICISYSVNFLFILLAHC